MNSMYAEQKWPMLVCHELGGNFPLVHGPPLIAIQVHFGTLQRNALSRQLCNRKSPNSVKRLPSLSASERKPSTCSLSPITGLSSLALRRSSDRSLLTRRPHTWSRCCHASFHLGPGQDHSLWCMEVSHFSQTGGIHCTPPAKIEKVI